MVKQQRAELPICHLMPSFAALQQIGLKWPPSLAATHLNRDVTTVQRWEKREGMPVHHLHDKRGSVYALSSELDAWLHSRRELPEEVEETAKPGALPEAEGGLRGKACRTGFTGLFWPG
jgi:hypothetical protein